MSVLLQLAGLKGVNSGTEQEDTGVTYRICVRKWFRLFTNEEVFVSTKNFINT